MNKTKCLLLAVATAAMTFTISCSDDLLGDGDSSSSNGGGGSSSSDGGSSSSVIDGGGSSSSDGGSSSSVIDGGGSSSSDGGGGGDGNSVSYHGKSYKIVTIGQQTWFAENLNYDVLGSKCYGQDDLVFDKDEDDEVQLSSAEVQANCEKYGRLYDWEAAKTACPAGWHIPSSDDWDDLLRYVDEQNDGDGYGTPYDSETAGKYLKAKSGWNSYSGTENLDTYEFSALPGSIKNPDYLYESIGEFGNWWSATEMESGSDFAYGLYMYYGDESAYWSDYDKSWLLSVRCLKD